MLDRATAAISICLLCAGSAQAANQLFNASWMTKSFGNERTGGTDESEFYSAFGIPQGVACNPDQPRCDFQSTPTQDGYFHPLGGTLDGPANCAPWYNFGGMGTAVRPAKGETPKTSGKNQRPIPPLYRNPAFFTPLGKADRFSCTATSTDGMGGKGLVQAGHPVRGHSVQAVTVGGAGGSLAFATAPQDGNAGIRATGVVGEFNALYPYLYTYTYATLRNAKGVFGPAKGPGAFNIQYEQGQNVVASINVKQGSAKFGGTMRMLGALHTKVCYYRNGGCSLGGADWLYQWIGTYAITSMGVVTQGYQVFGTAKYHNTGLGQTRTVNIEGSRFPWTTGSVTVTAVGRGPHKTVHYGQGYDNRVTISTVGPFVIGALQLVTPVMTRWLVPGASWETGGIGILRLELVGREEMEGDGVPDWADNCLIDSNSGQDDTDGDFCGNVCDTDYNQSGLTTIADFGEFSQKFGTTDPEFCHVQGISGSILPCVVGVDDFGVFAANFNTVPGPSGTTPGTVACPR